MTFNKDFMVSSKSACNSKGEATSYVVKAMFDNDKFANNTLRVSFSNLNTMEDVISFENAFDEIIQKHDLKVISSSPEVTQIRVESEKQAEEFLMSLIQTKKQVIRFELREPSLHEIFIEKVGNSDEKE